MQNSHAPVSRLPTELLSEVFLCIVESCLQYGGLGFDWGTFRFRQVCKHWNNVAVGFPQLWVRWAPCAVKAWPLFNACSKDAPIFLTWHFYHDLASSQDVLADPAVPGRIRQLDFSGTSKKSQQFFGAFDYTPSSIASSIRAHIAIPTHGAGQEDTEQPTQAHLARFFSSSFPKLSKLDIENFQPDSSSPVFTTSNLTSLKLSFPYGTQPRYTLAQLSRILQRHPNLQELDLGDGATPQLVSTDAPVPFTLLQLVDLKLCGVAGCILKLINLISLSLPLHNIVLHFRYPHNQNAQALVKSVKKILVAYYKCEGLDNPRKADHFTISSSDVPKYGPLTFVARSRSGPASTPQSMLELRFDRAGELPKIFPLFPLNDTQEFTIEGMALSSNQYLAMLRKVKGISHLHLSTLDIRPVLAALNPRNLGVSKGAPRLSRRITDAHVDDPTQQPVPELGTLTLSHLDFLHEAVDDMTDVMRGRRDCKIGLKRLIVRLCRVSTADDDPSDLENLVEEIKWVDVEDMGLGYEGSDEDLGIDEFGCYSDDYYY